MNALLLSALLSWCMAQSAKVVCGLVRYGVRDRSRMFWRIIWAGGMPSAHSAVVSSSTMVIYCTAGGQSPLFGLAMLFSFIVIYDRSRLYAIYRQFQLKYPWLKNEVRSDPILKDLVGHRISEILAGVLIGLGAGFAAIHFCIA